MQPRHPAIRMALALVALGAVLWGFAYLLVGSQLALQLYRPPLGGLPAHIFAARLAELDAAGPSGTVALVGPSTVREGFDPEEMQRVVPRLRFFNCGVISQGSIKHAEMLLNVMTRFDLHPEILVLGLNSRQIALRENLLARTGFVDLLDTRDTMALLPWEPRPHWPQTLSQVRAIRWWSLNRLATRLDTVLRYGLYRTHQLAFATAALTEQNFRRGCNTLEPPEAYLYRETEHSPAAFQRQLVGIQSRGMFDRDRYGGVEQTHGLHRVLTLARAIGPRVYVVVMPEHSAVIDDFGAYGDYAFNKVLDTYRGAGVVVLDYRHHIPDRLLRDMGHLVAEGRRQLSRTLAQELAVSLETPQTQSSDAPTPIADPADQPLPTSAR